MHDMLKGVCIYDLQHSLHCFIMTKKYFTLSDLNHRKNLFVYGDLNSANIINDIQETNLKKKKLENDSKWKQNIYDISAINHRPNNP